MLKGICGLFDVQSSSVLFSDSVKIAAFRLVEIVV